MPGPLRIVHIAATTAYIPWLLAIVHEQRARGHDVRVIINGRTGPLPHHLEREGVPFDVADLNAMGGGAMRRTGGQLVQLVRLLRRIRADVVQYHLYPSIIMGRLAAWLADAPQRVSMSPSPLYLESPVLGDIDAGTARTDTAVIATCERTRELYQSRGVPSRQLALVYYGLDERRFDPSSISTGRLREALGVSSSQPLVGMVAHFYEPFRRTYLSPPSLIGRGLKGHDVLLKAMARVVASMPDAKLVLVGKSYGDAGKEYVDSLRGMSRELGIERSVLFADEREDIPEVLADLDVSVHASLMENLGGSIESLAMAKPFVATRVGGLVDAVIHERTGLLVPPDDAGALADAILRLLRDRDYARNLGEAGRQLVLDRFTIGRTVDDLEALYARRASTARGYRLPVSLARVLALPARLAPLVITLRRAQATQTDQPSGTTPAPAGAARSGPLRIVHVIGTPDGAPWLAAIAREQRRRGHDLHVIVNGAEGSLVSELRAAGVPMSISPMSFPGPGFFTSVRHVRSLADRLRSLRPDVVQTHLFGSIVLGRLAARLADVPRRYSMIPGPYYLESPAYAPHETSTAWADSSVIASCERTRALYEASGLPPERVDVIYYGIDETRFTPATADPARVRRELGLSASQPVIGMVAYFYPTAHDRRFSPPGLTGRGLKGHDIAISAMRRILTEVPDAKLVFVGRGFGPGGTAHMDAMRQLAVEMGVADAVIFAGERHDIADTLAAFDVALQCSRSENLGGSLEALAMARPLIATRVGGLVDSVVHERTGLLVEPDDPDGLAAAVVRLLRDHALGSRLGEAGRRLILERFTVSRTADDLDRLYARAPKPGAPRRAMMPQLLVLHLRLRALQLSSPSKVWRKLRRLLRPVKTEIE